MNREEVGATLVLIRHGEAHKTKCHHDNPLLRHRHAAETQRKIDLIGRNPCLTTLGVEQASGTAREMHDALSKAREGGSLLVFSSPMNRAKDTLYQFQRKLRQPLHGIEPHYLDSLMEFSPNLQGTVEKFVEQIYALFDHFEKIANEAIIDKQKVTAIVFAHSETIGAFVTLLSTHKPGIDRGEHQRCVLDRLKPITSDAQINTAFAIANCSITVAQSQILPSGDDDELEWKLLSVGKNDHLRDAGIATGYQSDF